MMLYYCLIWSTRDMWVFVKQIDNLFPTFWVFWKSILLFQFVTGQIYLWLETFMFRPILNHNYFESLKFIFAGNNSVSCEPGIRAWKVSQVTRTKSYPIPYGIGPTLFLYIPTASLVTVHHCSDATKHQNFNQL